MDRRKSDFLFFARNLPIESNVLVIGACTGITTIPLANGQRNVYAYEPLESNFKILNAMVKYYKSIGILTFNIGMGNKTELRDLVLPQLNGAKKQGMSHIIDPLIESYSDGTTHSAELFRLDDRLELRNIKIDGIKIVAENFEFQILEGAKEIIINNRPLIYCELWDNALRVKVMELIEEYNYHIFFRNDQELKSFRNSEYKGKYFFFLPADA